ncbi:MAG: FimV/HubP family polar landmark protein [Gammaproteobacteria bacterium]|nr:FimV/HubP family polar landmark protein [Gammaproteobacteria bacterium]
MFPARRFALIALCLLLPALAQAVTLGEARVKSFLNQPLDVEIDLIGVAPGQHEALRLRVANQEYFDRLGIVYSTLLADLSFDVVRSGQRWLVRARTRRPVTEPFVDFPLQMTWPGGQMIRQYTLLLDPQRPIRPARATQTSRAAAPPPAPAPAATTAAAPRADSYGPVQRGETLWPIAKALRPAGITTRQMAMALLRANPQAFINGDINKLRAGATLTIPPLGFIEELDPRTAREQFAAATQRRAPAVATSPRATTAATAPAAPQAAPPPAATAPPLAGQPRGETPDDPQLRIVGEPGPDTADANDEKDLQEKLLVTMEEIESNRLNNEAIESRLARLEAEIARMQQLVELKDAQIAALQSEVSTRDAIDAAALAAEPAPPEPAVAASMAPGTASPGVDPVVAPTPIGSIDAVGPAARPSTAMRNWQEQYLWLIWVALALLAVTTLALLLRRPQPVAGEPAAVELPTVAPAAATASAGIASSAAPQAAELRGAEEDLRAVADARLPETDPAEQPEAALPELDISQITAAAEELEGGENITDSVLAEMLEESRLLPEAPTADKGESDFDDDDIASWIRELDNDNADGSESRSANDESLADDSDEIPSILTELDDQLTSSSSPEFPETPRIELEPVDEPVDEPADQQPPAAPPVEDDTFTMSLDLARAYLEIGDQEGARDMLQQALAGARDPDHRRQIEELLRQISS